MNRRYIALVGLLGLAGCTSLSEGQAPETTGPMERRVRYRDDPQTGLRDKMDEQASEINRKRDIEQFDQNKPAMTPPTQRPQEVPLAPVDSVNHVPPPPLNTTVPPRP